MLISYNRFRVIQYKRSDSNFHEVNTASEFVTSSNIRSSTRFHILCVFETFHSGEAERIQEAADLHARFAGYVWTEGESAKQ